MKVSDFGLARVLEDGKNYYRMGHNIALPVRWMAVESISDLVFTTESDIVSFVDLLNSAVCLSVCLSVNTYILIYQNYYILSKSISLKRVKLQEKSTSPNYRSKMPPKLV